MTLNLLLMIIALLLFTILSIPVMVFNVIIKLIRGDSISKYFHNIAVGIDQAGGSIIYDQEKFTISSWTWYMCSRGYKVNCIFMKFINILMMSPTHCEDSFKNEMHEIQEDGELK